MKVVTSTSPEVVAYVLLKGGRLLDVEMSSGRLAFFRFECPDDVHLEDYYTSEFATFKQKRNEVMDALNNFKLNRIGR